MAKKSQHVLKNVSYLENGNIINIYDDDWWKFEGSEIDLVTCRIFTFDLLDY